MLEEEDKKPENNQPEDYNARRPEGQMIRIFEQDKNTERKTKDRKLER